MGALSSVIPSKIFQSKMCFGYCSKQDLSIWEAHWCKLCQIPSGTELVSAPDRLSQEPVCRILQPVTQTQRCSAEYPYLSFWILSAPAPTQSYRGSSTGAKRGNEPYTEAFNMHNFLQIYLIKLVHIPTLMCFSQLLSCTWSAFECHLLEVLCFEQ